MAEKKRLEELKSAMSGQEERMRSVSDSLEKKTKRMVLTSGLAQRFAAAIRKKLLIMYDV